MNNTNLKIFGESIIDAKAIEQIKNCMDDNCHAVLTADAHVGYSMPIGGAIAYKDKISLSGIGFDISCGNACVKTDVNCSDLEIGKIMDEIVSRISFGIARKNNEPVDHPVFDAIAHADFVPQRTFLQLAKDQLGTVGSGNHFVDLFRDEDGYVWIGVHFGSRGFGHKTTMGFIAMHAGLKFTDKSHEGSMDSKPILFDVNTELGRDYMQAVDLASAYAYAGRETVIQKVLNILGNPNTSTFVHNNHNGYWKETHFGEEWYVVRKGCTPAFPNQKGFIGANMRNLSVIVEGIDSLESQAGLYSTVHGAGRILSRTQAAGKKKWIKNDEGRKVPTIISKGSVDFDAVKEEMRQRKIELRGAGADEAPACYKSLDEVLAYQGNTIKILHALQPIGVAMAGDEFDPYKD